jgi:hypothetical protein
MSKSKAKTLKGLKRGYVATLKTKVFNFGEGRHKYEVYELNGPKMDKPRYFVDELSVRMFVNANETETALTKSFENAVKRATSKSERREMQAAKELSELVPDLEVTVPAAIRDSQATRPEDTDK